MRIICKIAALALHSNVPFSFIFQNSSRIQPIRINLSKASSGDRGGGGGSGTPSKHHKSKKHKKRKRRRIESDDDSSGGEGGDGGLNDGDFDPDYN